jgi:hypothetical protein
MSEFDIVRELAKQTLAIRTPASELDESLWDRAQRLVRNVERICQLPELAETGLQIDRFCLIVAVYFSDTGLAHYFKREKQGAQTALSNANGDDLADFSTQIVKEKLGACIDEARIKKINRIIIESSSPNEFRRYIIGGKSICDALQSWKRKIDYRYWQARLKKSFRFESVRKLAEQRLSAAEHFMNQLEVETEAQDLKELIAESLAKR